MAFDLDYCYIVTTMAAVMIHHEYQYVTDALCNMILDGGRGGGREDGNVDRSYSIQKARLKPVLSKIIESIALNVVNSGHNVTPLPIEIPGLFIHIASASTFTAAVMAVQRSRNNILLYCGCFLGDIFLWLMAHFDRIIELSMLARKIIYEKAFRNTKIRVTMPFRESCNLDSSIHVFKDTDINVSVNLGGGRFKTILKTGSNHKCKGAKVIKEAKSAFDL